MFLKCFISSIEVNCLIDTGSTICILHPRKYNIIPSHIKPEIKKHNTKLCLADGGQIDTIGYVDLPVEVGDLVVTHRFTVADIDVPAVIGYDFLNKHNCTIDIGKGILTLAKNKIQCSKQNQANSVFKISLAERVSIPPNTEIITTGNVIGDTSSVMNAIIEPLYKQNTENVIVAKSLVDPSCCKIPLRMANISNSEITLESSTCVASCEQIDLNHTDVETETQTLMKINLLLPSKMNCLNILKL